MRFRITAVIVKSEDNSRHYVNIERRLSHSFQAMEALEAHVCELFDLTEAPGETQVLWMTAMNLEIAS